MALKVRFAGRWGEAYGGKLRNLHLTAWSPPEGAGGFEDLLERPPVILTCSGCCSLPPAQLGSIILGGWPSWGAPAPQTPRTWRLRRQQGSPKWGGGGRRPPRPCWRRRRQVRGVWGAGAPQEGQPPRIILPTCAGGWVLLALPHILSGEHLHINLGDLLLEGV